ncbi:ESPR-type extended signal peptide-containing protein [Acinetobacter nosocomialis]|uniref:ESPR-type extended signal peptide-containing protein n=3 Tax=Acinetobacter TaxID=469 RepID=UPI00254F83C9|nr:ESPR-type extended signal peptide-containing protein [Acinetobacter nosocomialis]MEC6035196.1 ESPR-type extended signal peptide-containing protein [Acinetobacter nosocomialis]
MNRIYRVVWNASIGAWVAVSENAKSKTKTKTVKVVSVAITIASSAVMPVYADVLAGNNITITPSGTDFVVATTDDVSLNKVTVGSVELDKTTSTVKVGTNTTLSTAGLDTDGSVKTGTLTTTGSATIGNGLTVANGTTALKNTSITGTLITTGNTTVGGTLGVTGATTLNNTLNVVGNTTLSNVTTTGSATIGNGLTVVNGTTALKNTSITGTLITTGNTTVGGTLGVTGATTLNNTLNVVGNTTLSNVTTTGSATIGNGLTVADGATALKNTNITGTLTTTGNTTVGGTLNVNGLATFNNGANLNNKKITGLAAGNINSATSTDAVNGGQLYTVNKNIADALGTKLDANGALENPTYTVSDGKGGTQAFNNVRQAIEYITGVDTGTGTGGVGVGIKYFHTNSAAVDSQSKGLESVAIGPQAIANGTSSIAMGDQARADQENAVAIGKQSAAIGLNSTAIGSTTGTPRQPVYTRDANNKITAIDGISVTTTGTGTNLTDITEINGVSVTNAQVTSFVASLSSGANLSLGKNSMALGTSNLAAGESSVALGDSSKAVAKDAIAIGRNGNASGEQAISIGAGAQAAASGALAAGGASSAGRDGAVALGQGAFANTTAGISIGQNAGVGTSQGITNDRTDHIAIGRNSGQNVIGNRNIALGVGAGSNLSASGNGSSDDNIAIGVNAGSNLRGDDNIAIGRDANKNITAVAESVAIGSRVDATTGSTVLGNEAKASGGDYATVLGYKAKVTGDSGTALGRDSEASANNIALGASSVANGTSTAAAYLTADTKAGGYNIVSVGQTGQERRITNVAAGANPTDAVNVKQLHEAQKNVASLIGGQTGVDPATGAFKGHIIELTDTTGQTHQYKDVASAINAVSSGAISVLPGNAVMYNADGGISNVAAGTNATDAVNLAQLNQAIAKNGQHHVSINSKNPANENNMGATADESLAIGAGVTTSNAGVKSVVIGFDAATNAKESVAIGNTSTQANGDASIAIGKTALAKSTNNIAMGTNASSNGMESIAIGTNIQIDKTTGISDYAVGIGSYSEVENADQAIAIGRKAIVQGDNGTAIGHESRAAKENASALGNFAKATAVSANAIGNYATASGTSANAIGDNAKATAGNANAMGKSAEATSTSSNAIGDNAKAAADNASAIGTNARATGVNANAMGKGAKAFEQDASAIGTGAQAFRQDTLALGTSAVASGLNASAIGKSADAAGLNANAFGNGAKAGAESSNAIGTGANVSATNGFALGTNATVTHTNAIALGSGSISGNATPTASAIVNGKTYNYSGINPTSTVSVGSLGNERQIINVAAGRVSGSSTDAINGSQLFQTNEELANLANKTAQALGGGALANQATGAISAPSYTVTTNPAGTGTKTTVNNVGAALTALDTAVNQPLSFAGDTGAQISRKLGETLNVKGGATGTLAGTGNIGVVANGTNQLDIRLAETINLGGNGSVTTGSASIKNNEVKVGTNTLTDTGLKAGNVKVNTSTNDVTGLSNITWNPAGTYNSGRAATEEQLLSAQNQLNTTLTDKGFSISAQGANSDKVKLGETVDFRNTDGNLVATRSADNTINYDLAKNISVDKVTLGNIIIDKATGINAGNQKITNVKAGDVNSTSTDAVNGSQLYTAQNNVKNVLGSSTQIDAAGNLTSTNIGGVTGANTVHDAIQQVNNTATNAKTQADKGLNFAVNGVTPADNVQLGETVNFADGTNTTATYDALTNTYKYSLNDTLSLSNAGSLSIKDSAGTGTVVSVDKTGVQSGSIKLDASTGKITGVTDGLVAAGSKEAVNGGQLDAVKAIANTGWKLTTDKTGTGAVAGSSVEQITPDETVTFIAGDNIAVEQAGNKVTVATKKDVVFDSVTAGGTVINNSGLSFVDSTGTLVANSPSISKTGINAGNQKITNVKAGDVNSTSTDAVNGSQLYTAQNNVKNVLGSSTQIDAAGNLTSTNIGGVTGANTVHDAIQQVNNTATNAKTQADKGLNFAVNGVTPADNVQLGETVNFADGTNTTATYDALTNTYKYSLNDTLSLSNAGSLSIKDSAGTGTVVSVDKTGVQSGSIKLDASTGKITGVTDGLVAAGSKEAVNGGQLDAVKAIANTGWKLTTDKTGTGAVAGSSVEQITPDETVTFIAGDNIAVEQAGNKVTVATKKDVVFDRVTSTDILGNTSILSATGIITQDKDGKKSASLSNTGLFVAEMNATGNTLSSSSLEAGKLTVKGTNTLVLDSVKGTLTGLSNKTLGSGDFASQGRAATEEQLNRAQSNVASILGGNAANNGGLLSMSNIGGTGESTIDDAIKSVNQVANNANKGWNVSTNGGTANNVKPNDTVDFSNKDGNVTVSNQGNNITVDLNKDIDLGAAGSVTTGDTKIDNNGLTIAGGPSVTKNGIDAGKQKVTNVADGKITADSQDAVNGGQIHDMMGAGAYDTNGNLSNIGGTGQSNINDAIAAVNKTAVQSKSTVTEGSNIKVVSNSNADGSTNYTVSTADDITLNSVTAKDINAGTVTTDKVVAGNTTVDSSGLSIKNGPSVTASGIDAGSKVVSNVSNGVQNSDAVNMGQLSQYLGGGAGYNNITQSFDAPNYQVNGGSYNNVGDALGALNQADQALGNRITNLGDQLQQAFYSTNQRIDDVEKKANAGIAAAMALENAPYIPGKYTYAAGAAYHGGENAIGLTLRKTADNGRWSLTGGVAAGSSGDPSVRVGISGVID